MKRKYDRYIGFMLTVLIFSGVLWLFLPGIEGIQREPLRFKKKKRVHLDHRAFFSEPFHSAEEVTKACLKCHENVAEDIMKTAHWRWEGKPVKVPGHKQAIRIGKKNLINNFCIGIRGNWISCTACHIGYGWKDQSFDFNNPATIDCLICHDWSGTYFKGDYGYPDKTVDLLQVAKQVGYPKRDNCGICHIYGGGGMGVKHGDLDNTLLNPGKKLDVHMGKSNLLCIDCHKTIRHNISGTSYSVSVNHENGISCNDCHSEKPHHDTRINSHLVSLACQTCHIPSYAKKAPTKTFWDWSKAGDASRKDDSHHYLKIKGEFKYAKKLIPEYRWFNLHAERYLLKDKIDPKVVTDLNRPLGNIGDPKSRIWPFRLNEALQPYDIEFQYLLQPVTSGKGGYWHSFDWDQALRLGAKIIGMAYSGKYGFARTRMYWPLSHMVTPATQALTCNNCHGSKANRMNWKKLGYPDDPIKAGKRDIQKRTEKRK